MIAVLQRKLAVHEQYTQLAAQALVPEPWSTRDALMQVLRQAHVCTGEMGRHGDMPSYMHEVHVQFICTACNELDC